MLFQGKGRPEVFGATIFNSTHYWFFLHCGAGATGQVRSQISTNNWVGLPSTDGIDLSAIPQPYIRRRQPLTGRLASTTNGWGHGGR